MLAAVCISRRPVRLLVAVIGLLAATPLCALEGRVVDAETGAPLQGAYAATGRFQVATDAQGRFALEASEGDSVTVSHVGYARVTVVPGPGPLVVRLQSRALTTPEVVVVGGLREEALSAAAASVTVMDRKRLREAGNHHFQDLAGGIANLNWAGGTSRPRYFQIRGVGERKQYAGGGPPNFSVGFVLDDVDLSGMGSAAALFDLQQVEVFKGPQSTIFGPNAMAGLISLQSADPGPGFGHNLSASVGSDALQRYAGAVSLPLGPDLAVRLGFHSARSNGFRDNQFLGRDDTNRRRESLARAKVRYQLGDLALKATIFHADMDNGYDAWTPDKSPDLVTHSDNPGRDHQQTTGLSLRGEVPLRPLGSDLVTITAYSQTDLEYSYDGDWGNDEFWGADPYGHDPDVEGWSYDFFDRTLRQRRTWTQELRLLRDDVAGGDAILGAYLKTMEEEDDAQGWLFGGQASALDSRFDVDGVAAYGQIGRDLRDNLRLSVNMRTDRTAQSYRGSTNVSLEPVERDQAQWLFGGKAGLTYRLGAAQTVYGALSRGYRAGGINQHPYLAERNRPYDPEFMTNLEVGWYSSSARTTTAATLFHSWRSQQQVSLSKQQDPGDPNSYFYFVANASTGRSSGMELEHTFRPVGGLRLSGSAGLLRTHVNRYSFEVEAGERVARGDRAAAHAPEYKLRLAGDYRHQSGVFGQLELTATDDFYYSDSHDQRSDAYQLVNGRVGFARGSWAITAWGRNLFDRRYAVRGFFFGLEPPLYEDTLYESFGDPRSWGVSLQTGI